MNKRVLASVILSGVVGAFVLASPAKANEGVVNLRSAGGNGACYASSVFIDGNYKILATCRDLKTALTPEKNRYVAWVEDENGKQKSLGEIQNGKLSTITGDKFIKMFVTAETDGYGNKPSEDVLLTGGVQAIDFGPGVVSAPIITPTPTPAKVTVTTVKNNGTAVTTDETATSQSGIGSAIGTILKIALLGFGVLLLVVGVFSFLSRRRSL